MHTGRPPRHLHRYGRLRQVQLLGRLGVAEIIGNRRKALQLSQGQMHKYCLTLWIVTILVSYDKPGVESEANEGVETR